MYDYAANNPVRYIDPTGRNSEDDVAKEIGNTSKRKGVDLNLFPSEHPKDILVTTESGKNIYTRTAANNAYRYAAMYYVGAHGSRNSVLSFGKDGMLQNGVRITPEKLVEMIRSDKKFHNQPVVLWICETGKDPKNQNSDIASFAQQVANCLGQKSIVIASVSYCEFDSYINELYFNGKLRKNRSYDVNPGEQYIFRGCTNEK